MKGYFETIKLDKLDHTKFYFNKFNALYKISLDTKLKKTYTTPT